MTAGGHRERQPRRVTPRTAAPLPPCKRPAPRELRRRWRRARRRAAAILTPWHTHCSSVSRRVFVPTTIRRSMKWPSRRARDRFERLDWRPCWPSSGRRRTPVVRGWWRKSTSRSCCWDSSALPGRSPFVPFRSTTRGRHFTRFASRASASEYSPPRGSPSRPRTSATSCDSLATPPAPSSCWATPCTTRGAPSSTASGDAFQITVSGTPFPSPRLVR